MQFAVWLPEGGLGFQTPEQKQQSMPTSMCHALGLCLANGLSPVTFKGSLDLECVHTSYGSFRSLL